ERTPFREPSAFQVAVRYKRPDMRPPGWLCDGRLVSLLLTMQIWADRIQTMRRRTAFGRAARWSSSVLLLTFVQACASRAPEASVVSSEPGMIQPRSSGASKSSNGPNCDSLPKMRSNGGDAERRKVGVATLQWFASRLSFDFVELSDEVEHCFALARMLLFDL